MVGFLNLYPGVADASGLAEDLPLSHGLVLHFLSSFTGGFLH